MDRGAYQATVHGVTKSQTRLKKQLNTHSSNSLRVTDMWAFWHFDIPEGCLNVYLLQKCLSVSVYPSNDTGLNSTGPYAPGFFQ